MDKLGLRSDIDLALHLPLRYEDETRLVPIGALRDGEVAQVVPGRFSATETFDIGMDLGSVVSPAYREHAPYPFTGTIDNIVIEVAPTQPVKVPE